jgi:uncharacterized membrane protein YgdD (TMEM256/DUF423 family)
MPSLIAIIPEFPQKYYYLLITRGTTILTRIFLAIASILGAISVVFGAFASHALKDRLSANSLAIWETGTKYQMYHALALMLVALLISRFPDSVLLVAAGYAFITGIFIFSGSLYALTLTGIRWLGAITPIGGMALIIGWLCLALATWRIE